MVMGIMSEAASLGRARVEDRLRAEGRSEDHWPDLATAEGLASQFIACPMHRCPEPRSRRVFVAEQCPERVKPSQGSGTYNTRQRGGASRVGCFSAGCVPSANPRSARIPLPCEHRLRNVVTRPRPTMPLPGRADAEARGECKIGGGAPGCFTNRSRGTP